MRKTDVTQHAMFSYRSLQQRISKKHSPQVAHSGWRMLQSLSADLAPLYSRRGRLPIGLER